MKNVQKKLLKIIFLITFFCIKNVEAGPLMNTPAATRYLDIELPFRCLSSAEEGEENISSVIVLSKNDFTVKLPAQTDRLPRFQVNGFSFKNKTADVAISKLLKEADIRVEAEPGAYLTLSAKDLKGELSGVLEQLVRQGHLFYTYHADERKLVLSHKAKAIIQLPHEKAILMAIADALSGGHFEPISINWSDSQISLRVSRTELEQIRALMADLIQEKYLISVKMRLYVTKPLEKNSHWQNVLSSFGPLQFSSISHGVAGHALILRKNTDERAFMSAVKRSFQPALLGGGKAIVPSSWKTRFNVNQCAFPAAYKNLSVLFKSSIIRKDSAQTILTLDSTEGEIVTFDMDSGLDQRIVVVGVPVPNFPEQEFMMTMQVRFIQLLKEGENND